MFLAVSLFALLSVDANEQQHGTYGIHRQAMNANPSISYHDGGTKRISYTQIEKDKKHRLINII